MHEALYVASGDVATALHICTQCIIYRAEIYPDDSFINHDEHVVQYTLLCMIHPRNKRATVLQTVCLHVASDVCTEHHTMYYTCRSVSWEYQRELAFMINSALRRDDDAAATCQSLCVPSTHCLSRAAATPR
jgi:hypothetical protein